MTTTSRPHPIFGDTSISKPGQPDNPDLFGALENNENYETKMFRTQEEPIPAPKVIKAKKKSAWYIPKKYLPEWTDEEFTDNTIEAMQSTYKTDKAIREESRAQVYDLEAPPRMHNKFKDDMARVISDMQTFIVQECAPFEVAMDTAQHNAMKLISQITGIPESNASINVALPMVILDKAIQIKLAREMCSKANVDKAVADELIKLYYFDLPRSRNSANEK